MNRLTLWIFRGISACAILTCVIAIYAATHGISFGLTETRFYFGARSVQAQTPAGEMDMQHKASVPSTTLKVTGLDGKETTYNAADLKAMPHKTVAVYNEHAKTNESYSGVPLTELLAKAGAPTGEKLRGKGFLLYVVAEGTDHYKVVYSIDETDPANHAGDVIVADTLNGAAIAADGAFKLVSSEDKRPARWVRSLSVITLKSAE